ncbi:MAG: 2,3-bisphosphoglycerate-independent phosphoglycerate mutase [Methanosarcinaceae archaeon]|nr:2,3-bisphosphoglycerate-independent phosphoglycerate mutase [Methanosarcinaceae archaeon]
MTKPKRPLLLMILDGWGYLTSNDGNAILAANTPNLDRLVATYPTSILEVSGEAVGLPGGQMGNSEVGHLNIGAGRVVYQDLTRINHDIKTGDLYTNPVLLNAIKNAKEHDSALHLMGLLSDGGVHSHINHLSALIDLASREGLERVYIHAFLDGRDVPPACAIEDIQKIEKTCDDYGIGRIVTVSGRYYAMDRDTRWERVKLAYDALTLGTGLYAKDAETAVRESYARNETDEFVKPTVIVDKNGNPTATIKNNDSVIFFNFRPDRARQLTYAFVDDDFGGFERKVYPKVHFVCMTQYDEKLEVPIAYPHEDLKNTLGQVLSKNHLKQLRIAETEKYAHVTFFFNGGVEVHNEGEDRCLIPSPKVATYDLKPEMSAYEVTKEVIKKIRSDKYDVIILNYANLDMVGHTGFFDATVSAVETIDECVGKVIDTLLQVGGAAIITADHGNAEQMLDHDSEQPHTAHTCNPVRCIYVTDKSGVSLKLRDGKLSDIAPTMLKLLRIEKPVEMTGESLIV